MVALLAPAQLATASPPSPSISHSSNCKLCNQDRIHHPTPPKQKENTPMLAAGSGCTAHLEGRPPAVPEQSACSDARAAPALS